jgi:hypothetical protein
VRNVEIFGRCSWRMRADSIRSCSSTGGSEEGMGRVMVCRVDEVSREGRLKIILRQLATFTFRVEVDLGSGHYFAHVTDSLVPFSWYFGSCWVFDRFCMQ